jgi:hypothetical protein
MSECLASHAFTLYDEGSASGLPRLRGRRRGALPVAGVILVAKDVVVRGVELFRLGSFSQRLMFARERKPLKEPAMMKSLSP